MGECQRCNFIEFQSFNIFQSNPQIVISRAISLLFQYRWFSLNNGSHSPCPRAHFCFLSTSLFIQFYPFQFRVVSTCLLQTYQSVSLINSSLRTENSNGVYWNVQFPASQLPIPLLLYTRCCCCRCRNDDVAGAFGCAFCGHEITRGIFRPCFLFLALQLVH